MTKTKKVDPQSASLPPEYTIADAAALQALEKGQATPEQQKRALAWIIQQAAGTYELSYRQGDAHDTSFAEGRRFCGLQVVKLIKLNIEKLKQQGEPK